MKVHRTNDSIHIDVWSLHCRLATLIVQSNSFCIQQYTRFSKANLTTRTTVWALSSLDLISWIVKSSGSFIVLAESIESVDIETVLSQTDGYGN